MGKLWSTLGTDDNLVYVVMGCIMVAFVCEVVKMICNVYDNFRYGEE